MDILKFPMSINVVAYIFFRIIYHYHIFCCNMFVFACPIIARSQCWLFALRANISEFDLWYLHSGLK